VCSLATAPQAEPSAVHRAAQVFQDADDALVVFWTLGAVCVLLAVPVSLHSIHMHVIHYVSPLQRHYVRILWMVPIYALCSWLALRFNEQKLLLETIREFYESYVVYSFLKLMQVRAARRCVTPSSDLHIFHQPALSRSKPTSRSKP